MHKHDVDIPVTNPNFVAAFQALSESHTEQSQRVFLEELKKARFLAPVMLDPKLSRGDPEIGEATLQKGTNISFMLIEREDGSTYYPAFTDWEELRKWNQEPDISTWVLELADYRALFSQGEPVQKGFVINPLSQSLLISSEWLRGSEGGFREHTVEEDTQVLLGEPKEYPYEMAEALKAHLREEKSVKKAYLQLMVKGEEKSYLLVIDFADAERRALFDGIAHVARPYLDGMFLDMIPYDEDFGGKAAEGKKPFYRKKLFGLF